MTKTEAPLAARVKGGLLKFLLSDIYPPVIAISVLLGHIFGVEVYLGAAVILLTSLALFITDSIKPFLITLICFLYIVPLKHTEGIPANTDYYFATPRLIIVIILVLALSAALIYRCSKLIPRFKKNTPMLLPTGLLCIAFLTNGFFCGGYNPVSFVYGLSQVAVFFILFYLCYFGLSGESYDSMMRYLTLITVCAAMVLVGEVAFMYLTYDNLFVGGAINKEAINLGWGIWNPIGVSLATLIPVQLIGAMRYKRPYIYGITAALTYLAALLTLSRNAMIFSTVAVVLTVAVCCFAGKRKKAFRIGVLIVAGALTLLGAVAAVLFMEKLIGAFSEVLAQGLSNNGRFDLWLQGLKNFASYPIFGKGFLGFGENDVFEAVSFIPDMAHNTAVQLLSSMGIFGFLAYAYYRAVSLKPFLKAPTAEKTVMLISIMTVLVMSLMDNFVFYIYTMFYPILLLAVAYRYRG